MRFYLAILLFILSPIGHAIEVRFSGELDRFNTGPFSGGDSFFGSFTIDESVVPTGTGSQLFSGAIDNFQLTVAGNFFSGENGRLLQLDLTGGADALGVSIGNGHGTVDDHGFGNDFDGVSFDWRGPQLFPNPSVLASDLTTADFNYRRIVMRFGVNTLTYAIDNVDFIEFTGSPVPAPASVWLAAVGLGLFLKKRVPALTKSQG